jgi:putative transposon-encoded protein
MLLAEVLTGKVRKLVEYASLDAPKTCYVGNRAQVILLKI